MSFLSIREYSRKELFYKLKAHVDEELLISNVLDELEALGYLSEERFVESYVHSYQNKHGSLRIKHNLKNKGIDELLAKQYLNEISREDEIGVATNLLVKKIGNNEVNSKIIMRAIRFLLNRGFSMDIISEVLRNLKIRL